MASTPNIAAIVVAAGSGERANRGSSVLPKQYRTLLGTPVLSRTIGTLLHSEQITSVLPVISAEHVALYEGLNLSGSKLYPPVFGGGTRQASVLAGLEALAAHPPEMVLIQDGARPLVSGDVITGVIDALARYDAAVPVLPVTDTIKRSFNGVTVRHTEERHTLFSAQTPQGFRYAPILAAHRQAAASSGQFTDDAAVAEGAGLSVAITRGSVDNLKLTIPEDFARAERLLNGQGAVEARVGSGFDVHPFEPGDHVVLGGVRIAHTHGLKGHSDADAALHALTDALYGALGEGDIGTHFPPSDPQWRGAASALFLQHAVELVAARRGRIVNLDLTLVCEEPRIGPHVAAMRQRIGEICGIALGRVAVKATTSERLGFTGRREGIVAMATASIELPRD